LESKLYRKGVSRSGFGGRKEQAGHAPSASFAIAFLLSLVSSLGSPPPLVRPISLNVPPSFDLQSNGTWRKKKLPKKSDGTIQGRGEGGERDAMGVGGGLWWWVARGLARDGGAGTDECFERTNRSVTLTPAFYNIVLATVARTFSISNVQNCFWCFFATFGGHFR